MAEAMTLKVLTSEGLSREEAAVSVIAPGGLGYLGMLRNHAPLVTTLAPGKLIWQRPTGERLAMRIGAGLLEVVKNQITVLTDSVSEPQPERVERRF
jgi:F-type H+-transporting ATPase subunit epsilon